MLHSKIKPLVPYVNAVTKCESECLLCGNKIYPKLNNVQNGSGCIYCSDSGFNMKERAYLYLIVHSELNSFKIGIGGSKAKKDRIETHLHYGWSLYKRTDFETGLLAYEVEQDLLTWFRYELGLGVHLLREQMPQGGHTETVDATEIDLPTIWAKVEELSKVKK